MADLAFETYGKSGIRLLQVLREKARHEVVEITVNILFQGDFADSYTLGDNSSLLPTDTMKNTVYAIARQKPIHCIERFASDLAEHFASRVPHLKRVQIDIAETPWARLPKTGDAFFQQARERRTTRFMRSSSEQQTVSGLRNLQILKTCNSAFGGYIKDEYTTLAETEDRLLGTVLDADWTYASNDTDFDALHIGVRDTLLKIFAAHASQSVQHTLYAMAEAVMRSFENIADIHLTMPNKHCLLVDLAKFGLDNPNQIFVPVDEPSGYIEARLSR